MTNEGKTPIPMENPYEGIIAVLNNFANQCVPEELDIKDLTMNARRQFVLHFIALAIRGAMPDEFRKNLIKTCQGDKVCQGIYSLDGEPIIDPKIIEGEPEGLSGNPSERELRALIASTTTQAMGEEIPGMDEEARDRWEERRMEIEKKINVKFTVAEEELKIEARKMGYTDRWNGSSGPAGPGRG